MGNVRDNWPTNFDPTKFRMLEIAETKDGVFFGPLGVRGACIEYGHMIRFEAHKVPPRGRHLRWDSMSVSPSSLDKVQLADDYPGHGETSMWLYLHDRADDDEVMAEYLALRTRRLETQVAELLARADVVNQRHR